MSCVRLTASEHAAFAAACASSSERPARVQRRLIREYVTGSPDYFSGELGTLRSSCDSLARVGNNLNQLVRLAHEGSWPAAGELVSILDEVLSTVTAMKRAIGSEVRRVEERRV
jgi:hypothetical protein